MTMVNARDLLESFSDEEVIKALTELPGDQFELVGRANVPDS